jgi:hypothetical protein
MCFSARLTFSREAAMARGLAMLDGVQFLFDTVQLLPR